jgi:hypothetical protein
MPGKRECLAVETARRVRCGCGTCVRAPRGAEIVVVEQSGMLVYAKSVIAEAAAVKKLPTLYGYHQHVTTHVTRFDLSVGILPDVG